MNPFQKSLMRLFAAPRINMLEDYEKVRRLQRGLAAPRSLAKFRALDVTSFPADGKPPVPLRVFTPREQRRDDVLVFFHGGGWVTGDIESYTPACQTMADLTGAVVVSVDYRLAPEHPFPAGLEDCYRIARLFLEDPGAVGIDDPARVVLVGDSAGGNLAAAVSLLLRESSRPIPQRQIMLYPVTHFDHDPATSPFESVRRHGEDYRLTNTEIQDYFELYVPDPEHRRHRMVAPLMAEDLRSQPRTLIITAELDLLVDEGEAYGRALADAGNDVRIERIEGALHGFITLPRFARPLRTAYGIIDEFLDGEQGALAGGAA
ncbi:alpha/beta hydrolase [Brachybacterium sp. JHP9]|uniref:Alpha/beta hydrolase n=1 Tax=Brachybacterium equifaecis TaxID=2910770 RepID=A0ABT0R1V2_9MICO|nr:alpha/beta hydrolase [Brachybacterium equifaecis]